MNFTWVESLLMGLVSGIADIVPVSAEAHRIILLKLFGKQGEPDLLRLFVHLGIMVALFWANQCSGPEKLVDLNSCITFVCIQECHLDELQKYGLKVGP